MERLDRRRADEVGRDLVRLAEPERQDVGVAEARVRDLADLRAAERLDGGAGGGHRGDSRIGARGARRRAPYGKIAPGTKGACWKPATVWISRRSARACAPAPCVRGRWWTACSRGSPPAATTRCGSISRRAKRSPRAPTGSSAAGPGACRSTASRSRSRTTSTSPASRRPRPVRTSRIRRPNRRRWCRRSSTPARSRSGRRTSTSSRPGSWARARRTVPAPIRSTRATSPAARAPGSAVAVAAGLVSFALGTDTAGSGRVPAAFNNLVGLKPTKGVLSSRGMVPACRSLDCVSVFALTARGRARGVRRRARVRCGRPLVAAAARRGAARHHRRLPDRRAAGVAARILRQPRRRAAVRRGGRRARAAGRASRRGRPRAVSRGGAPAVRRTVGGGAVSRDPRVLRAASGSALPGHAGDRRGRGEVQRRGRLRRRVPPAGDPARGGAGVAGDRSPRDAHRRDDLHDRRGERRPGPAEHQSRLLHELHEPARPRSDRGAGGVPGGRAAVRRHARGAGVRGRGAVPAGRRAAAQARADDGRDERAAAARAGACGDRRRGSCGWRCAARTCRGCRSTIS